MNIFAYLYSLDPGGMEILGALWLGLMFLLATPVFHDAIDWHIEERRKDKERRSRRDG